MKLKFLLVLCALALLSLASPTLAQAATLSLSPNTGNYTVGDTITLQVVLDTGAEQTSAVDTIINFNPSLIQVQQITPGTLLATYLGESIDNSQGKATISAVASGPSALFQGQGVFATFTLQALAAGSAAVTFDFILGAVNDCNVAYAGNDLLVSVTNGSYAIASAGSPASATATPTPTATSAPTAGGATATVTPTPTATVIPGTPTPTPTAAAGTGGGVIATRTPTPTPTRAALPVTGGLPPTLAVGILGTIALIFGGVLLFL